MNFPTSVLLVLAVYAAQQSFAEDRVAAWPWPRIVEGEDAQDNEFPYQVALLDNGTFYCGGVILTSNYIVTAMQCQYKAIEEFRDGAIVVTMFQRQPSTLSVRAGSTSHNRGGQVIAVSRYITHPFDGSHSGDIALLRLSSPLSLNTENVAAIPLATSPPPENSLVTIVGWGQTSLLGQPAEHLQVSQVNVVPTTQCWSTGIDFICLQGNGSSTACRGDSGGAAIYEGTLVGVVSYVDLNCDADKPFKCTSAPAYIDWLKENSDL